MDPIYIKSVDQGLSAISFASLVGALGHHKRQGIAARVRELTSIFTFSNIGSFCYSILRSAVERLQAFVLSALHPLTHTMPVIRWFGIQVREHGA